MEVVQVDVVAGGVQQCGVTGARLLQLVVEKVTTDAYTSVSTRLVVAGDLEMALQSEPGCQDAVVLCDGSHAFFSAPASAPKYCPRAVVVADEESCSPYGSAGQLGAYMDRHGVPVLAGFDSRALARELDNGATMAILVPPNPPRPLCGSLPGDVERPTSQPTPPELSIRVAETTLLDVVPEKVLVLGSLASTEEDASFYDGDVALCLQALRALSIRTVLISPHTSFIQCATDRSLADTIYCLPVNCKSINQVLALEHAEAIVGYCGGPGLQQWLFSVADELAAPILGGLDKVTKGFDGPLGATSWLRDHGFPSLPSVLVRKAEEASTAKLEFPILVRSTTDRTVSKVLECFDDLEKSISTLFAKPGVSFTLETHLLDWRVMNVVVGRDRKGTTCVLGSGEQVDPTQLGDAFCVFPLQTLGKADQDVLFTCARNIIASLPNFVGYVTARFAVSPSRQAFQYYVVDVLPFSSPASLHLSSALGVSLSYTTAQLLASNSELPDTNANSGTIAVTLSLLPGATGGGANSRPVSAALVPSWSPSCARLPLSPCTALAGVNFAEVTQKTLRASGVSCLDFFSDAVSGSSLSPTTTRLRALFRTFGQQDTMEALRSKARAEGVDLFFAMHIHRIASFTSRAMTAANGELAKSVLLEAKRLGFSDAEIAVLHQSTEAIVRKQRQDTYQIYPGMRCSSGCAGGVWFSSYHVHSSQTLPSGEYALFLGQGIGASRNQHDHNLIAALRTFTRLAPQKSMVMHCGTYGVLPVARAADVAIMDETTPETALEYYRATVPAGIVPYFGGAQAFSTGLALREAGAPVLGSPSGVLDTVSNRFKFARLLDSLKISQCAWRICRSRDQVEGACGTLGLPLSLRPAGHSEANKEYHVYSVEEAYQRFRECGEEAILTALHATGLEVTVHAVVKLGKVEKTIIVEHVQNCVRASEATLVFPTQRLSSAAEKTVIDHAVRLAEELEISGVCGLKFVVADEEVMLAECFLRGTQTLPFVSFVSQTPFVDAAMCAMLERDVTFSESRRNFVKAISLSKVAVRCPVFAYTKTVGDPIPGRRISAAGEVVCFGKTAEIAYLKALAALGYQRPRKGILLSLGSFRDKSEVLPLARLLVTRGFALYGSPGTADYMQENGVKIKVLDWQDGNDGRKGIVDHIRSRVIELCIVTPSKMNPVRAESVVSAGNRIRREAVNQRVPLITNAGVAQLCLSAILSENGADEVVDNLVDSLPCGRTAILPGLVDVHVHLREPGGEYKETWETGTAAALAGGLTTVLAMPNTKPSIVDQESYDVVTACASRGARCDYGIYVGGNDVNALTLLQLTNADSRFGGIAALKMYLNDTFSTLKLPDMASWVHHFQHWPKDLPMVCHAEGQTMAAVLLLAKLYDRPVHIAHVSLKTEVDIIRMAKSQGIRVTCEVCPHHLFFTQEDFSDRVGEYGTLGKMEVRPRLATAEDKEALWANLDVIDIIATDHAPHTYEEKNRTDPPPPPGFPGLETVVPLMLTAINDGRLSLEDLVEKMHTNPCRIFGLPPQPDTYVEVDMDERWTFPEAMPESKCRWTPFEFMPVHGRIRRVVLRGELLFVDGKVLAKPGTGKNVRYLSGAPVSRRDTTPPPVASLTTTAAKTTVGSRVAAPLAKAGVSEATRSTVSLLEKPSVLEKSAAKTLGLTQLTTVRQLNRDVLSHLFNVASELRTMIRRMGSLDLLRGKVLASIFYEPSTRTSCSFTAAMQRLGGSVIAVNESSSSAKKGESLADTVRTMECYTDIIVLRHPRPGSAQEAADAVRIPLVNAGDGTGEHPTQALLDSYTIREELGTLNGLTITMVGDLKHGRTVHSLVQLLSLYSVKLNYVAPSSLAMPRPIVEALEERGTPQKEYEDLLSVIPETDVLYVTRIQRERFACEADYEKVRNSFLITPQTLTHAKESMVVMHPLPRVNEIAESVDADPRAAYFRQMECGMYARMALLAVLLGKA